MWQPSEYPLALQFVVVVLATYRLASLLAREEGPYIPLGTLKDGKFQTGVFERLRQLAGAYGEQSTSLSRGVQCPLCIGVYAAALIIVLWSVPYADLAVIWLGVAGGAKFLYQLHGGD